MNLKVSDNLPMHLTSHNLLLDLKKTFEEAYCNCTEKHNVPCWCGHWSSTILKPFCILNGGLSSEFCPGAIRLTIHGKAVDDYFSSDESVCNRAKC